MLFGDTLRHWQLPEGPQLMSIGTYNTTTNNCIKSPDKAIICPNIVLMMEDHQGRGNHSTLLHIFTDIMQP